MREVIHNYTERKVPDLAEGEFFGIWVPDPEGYSYSLPGFESLEKFTGIDQAELALEERYMDRWRNQDFYYVFKEPASFGTPGVPSACYIEVHKALSPDVFNGFEDRPEPDLWIVLDKRGNAVQSGLPNAV